jgi:hypothetical protein
MVTSKSEHQIQTIIQVSILFSVIYFYLTRWGKSDKRESDLPNSRDKLKSGQEFSFSIPWTIH